MLGAEDGLVCAHQAEEAQETSPGRRRLLLARLASPPPSPPAPLTSPPPAPPPPSTTPHANTAPGRRHRDLTQPLPAGRSGQPRPRSQIRKRGSGSPSPSRAHGQGDRPGPSRTLVGRRAPGVPAPRLDLRGWALTDAGSLSHETLGNRGTAARAEEPAPHGARGGDRQQGPAPAPRGWPGAWARAGSVAGRHHLFTPRGLKHASQRSLSPQGPHALPPQGPGPAPPCKLALISPHGGLQEAPPSRQHPPSVRWPRCRRGSGHSIATHSPCGRQPSPVPQNPGHRATPPLLPGVMIWEGSGPDLSAIDRLNCASPSGKTPERPAQI